MFPLILFVMNLITLAFPLVRPGEPRFTTIILSRMLHVFFVGLSTARSSFASLLRAIRSRWILINPVTLDGG